MRRAVGQWLHGLLRRPRPVPCCALISVVLGGVELRAPQPAVYSRASRVRYFIHDRRRLQLVHR
ncbi:MULTISPECIES: hypothetical protein [Actinoalloteichus]|uniref:Uncharacterized protein n=1 Tax=Actinoalloteichus fjordicus TaxID=1612552 RepID=A0AAC9PQQ0_9PSEU|nr:MULTISPECIES: hypothetical protein [Actinoalloteichus]APU13384.1 hypothetical protein UA74_06555 [Actinoalloteichus fjordicus]APU19334.1 hypothetical protein UA75_06555 [Actinoalloteichus sp. GBA129-24]